MNDHVSKPIDPDALFHTLRQWLPSPSGKPLLRRRRVATPRAGDALELPRLPGLDVASGLRRVAGNRRLYWELLGKYASGQAEALVRIRAALDQGDVALAERLAHTLQGVSGNIGATAVQQLAAELSQALRRAVERATLERLLIQLHEALEALLSGLRGALAVAPAAPAPATTLGREQVAPVLQRLETLLSNDDAEAADYLSAHRSLLAEALPIAAFLAIEQATADYRFEEALEKLQAVMQALPTAESD